MKSLPRGPAGPGEVWPASLTPRGLGRGKTRRWRFPSPRKASKHAAGDFRGLGKRQNAPLEISDASEGSKHAAEGFRGLGRVKTRRWRFPTRRKGQTGVWINHQRHEKSLIGGVVPMRLLKRDRPPRGGADQRNPVPCLPESRTSFMLAGSTRRRTPAG